MKLTLPFLIGLTLLGQAAKAQLGCTPGNAGSYTINAAGRWVLMADQLDQGTGLNDFNHVLATAPLGTVCQKFDYTAQSFLPQSVKRAAGWTINYSFAPGEGAFIFAPIGSLPFTISGSVPGPFNLQTFTAGYYAYVWGRPCPDSNPARPADIVDIVSSPFQDYDEAFVYAGGWAADVYDLTLDGGWQQGGGAGPAVLAGQAMAFKLYGGPPGYNPFLLSPAVPSIPSGLSVDVQAFYPFPLRAPCCGQSLTYAIFYVNNDSTPLAVGATLAMVLPALVGSPTSMTAYPTWTAFTVGAGLVTFTLPALGAYDLGVIYLTVPVSGCTPPTFNTLNASATLTPIAASPVTGTHSAVTTCSYDPNDKTVTPQGCGPEGFIPSNTPLTYTVQFQNLGTGPASQVVVRDTIHPNLDLGSLQMLASSHPYSISVNGRQVIWTFSPINLPAASADEPRSHGYVKFTVNQNPNLAPTAVITNQAAIYFDLNPAVLTATTTNTITTSPVPRGGFTVSHSNPLVGSNLNFTYTGGTAGASFAWDFGPGAVPATSTAQNPSGVIYTTPGPKLPILTVSLGGCQAEPSLVQVNVGSTLPSLNAQRSGSQVLLTWNDAAYHLQATPVLAPVPVWTNVPGAYSVNLPVTPGALFFRLVNP